MADYYRFKITYYDEWAEKDERIKSATGIVPGTDLVNALTNLQSFYGETCIEEVLYLSAYSWGNVLELTEEMMEQIETMPF